MNNRYDTGLRAAPRTAVQTVPATPGGLIRSTLLAAGAAGAVLVLFWLPAEYGIDRTGMGRLTGLTEIDAVRRALATRGLDLLTWSPAADALRRRLAVLHHHLLDGGGRVHVYPLGGSSFARLAGCAQACGRGHPRVQRLAQKIGLPWLTADLASEGLVGQVAGAQDVAVAQ